MEEAAIETTSLPWGLKLKGGKSCKAKMKIFLLTTAKSRCRREREAQRMRGRTHLRCSYVNHSFTLWVSGATPELAARVGAGLGGAQDHGPAHVLADFAGVPDVEVAVAQERKAAFARLPDRVVEERQKTLLAFLRENGRIGYVPRRCSLVLPRAADTEAEPSFIEEVRAATALKDSGELPRFRFVVCLKIVNRSAEWARGVDRLDHRTARGSCHTSLAGTERSSTPFVVSPLSFSLLYTIPQPRMTHSQSTLSRTNFRQEKVG
jgi:hypothetical protein